MHKFLIFLLCIYIYIYFLPLYQTTNLPAICGTKNIRMYYGIPLVIYRTWNNDLVNKKMFNDCHLKWFEINHQIRMEWFNDRERLKLVQTFTKDIVDAYLSLKPGAYKADLFRLCVLYKYGGIYADAHTMPYKSLDYILKDTIDRNEKHHFISVLDSPRFSQKISEGIHNGFIICTPRHPFIFTCINDIIENVKNKNYTSCPLGITGPVCLFKAINKTLKRNPLDTFKYGLNKFENYSIFLLRHEAGPFQYIYKNDTVVMCKKHCLLTYTSKIGKSSYSNMWKAKDVFYSYNKYNIKV